MIAKEFPQTHYLSGVETGFRKNIVLTVRFPDQFLKIKLHTIRGNWPLWRERFQKIENDEAYLSLREWSGKPYRSKMTKIMDLYKSDGIGLEKLTMAQPASIVSPGDKLERFEIVAEDKIALYDGLLIDSFKEWFKDYPDHEPRAIIHFTDFRYCTL